MGARTHLPFEQEGLDEPLNLLKLDSSPQYCLCHSRLSHPTRAQQFFWSHTTWRRSLSHLSWVFFFTETHCSFATPWRWNHQKPQDKLQALIGPAICIFDTSVTVPKNIYWIDQLTGSAMQMLSNLVSFSCLGVVLLLECTTKLHQQIMCVKVREYRILNEFKFDTPN